MSLTIFKSRLKAKIRTLGVNNLTNERIDAFAAALQKKNPDLKDDDETGHDAKIDELNEVVDLAKIAKDDDRLRTAELKLKNIPPPKNPEEDEEEQEEEQQQSGNNVNGKQPPKKDRTPAWAKTLMDEVQSLKREKAQQTIQEKIKGHDKLRDVPADFYDEWVKPEKDEDVDAFAEKVSTKYQSFKQVKNNEKASGNTKPINAAADTSKVDQKEVAALVDELMPQTKQVAQTT